MRFCPHHTFRFRSVRLTAILDLKGIPTRPSLPTALRQRLRHVLDLLFLNLSLPVSSHCNVSPGPFDTRHSPLLQPESPLLKRKEENTTRQTARLVFKLAEEPANPRQAETETRFRARRRARGARNSQFKPQRLPGGQSRRRLERPTNHRPEGGASGRGAWPRVCALSPASLP